MTEEEGTARSHGSPRERTCARATGDRMPFSPPLVISRAEIDDMIAITRKGLDHAWKVMKG